MLFHKEIGFPKSAESLYGRKFKLTYSNHAKRSVLDDKHGIIDKPPLNLEITKDNLIELELTGGLISKAVIRLPYDKTRDVVIAIIPDYNIAIVKTLWFNLTSDIHKTLNKSLYDKP